MNATSPHPSSGVCQHGESRRPIDCPHGRSEQVGRRCRHNPELGIRIRFDDLPADCRRIVQYDYCDLWGLQHALLEETHHGQENCC